MKVLKVYGVQLAIVLLVILYSVFFLGKEKESTLCEEIRDGWVLTEKDGSERHYEELPEFIYSRNGNEVVLSRVVDDTELNNTTIGFFLFEQQAYVYLDDTEIMCYVPDENTRTKNPGNSWKFIELEPEDVGKTLSIKLIQCYSENRVKLPVLYKGTAEGIMINYMNSALPMFVLSVLGIAIGLVVLIICFIWGRTHKLGKDLLWLGIFAIFRGIWSAIEANFYSFFYTDLIMFSVISYLSLKMSVVPFILFDNYAFHQGKSKWLNGLVVASVAEFWICGLLQLFGLVDYADTVFITHIIIFMLAISVCKNWVKYVVLKQKNEVQKVISQSSYKAHGIFMLVIAVTSLLDVWRYYFSNSPDIAKFSRLGYLAYIVVVVLMLVMDFMKLVSIGRQAATIREEASMDSMTKLWNRASFEKDIDKPSEKERKNMGIIISDLNNLKQFNDNYGHDMGDYYIKVSSEVLRDVFSKWGNVYRIGGDEFCAIVEGLTVEEFEKAKNHMESQISNLRIPNYELKMEIAAGFCLFNEELDQSLRDTMKRADMSMYERKQELKRK